MTWPRGRRRNQIDAARFMRAMVSEFGARRLASAIGCLDRTIRRWASGEDWCDAEVLHRLVDVMFPLGHGSIPIYSVNMAIDGYTRVGGVGEYTLRISRGTPCRDHLS